MQRICLLLFVWLAFGLSDGVAQTDTTFWFVATDVQQGHGDRPIFLRLIAGDNGASIQVSQPANPGFTPITQLLAPNATGTIDLTTFIDDIETSPPDVVDSTGILIESDEKINAYYDIANASNPDLYPLKGRNALGTNFYIPGQNTYANIAASSFESFEIVATENNTTVEITVTADVVGHTSGETFTVVLDRGETFGVRAASPAAGVSLAGSQVTADKPIAITGSDDSIGLGLGLGGYDLIGDQLVPTDVLGDTHIAIQGFAGDDERLYILATEDNTEVFVDGAAAPAATLNAGESFEIEFINSTIYAEATKNVYALHLSGHPTEYGSALLPPITCTGAEEVSFVRNSSGDFALLILVPTDGEDDFTLNGDPALVPASAFAPVPGSNGDWQFARIEYDDTEVPTGTASTIENSSTIFHVGMLNQLGGSSSYGFFSDYSSLNLGSDRLICQGETTQLDAGEDSNSYLWSTGETTQQITVSDTGTYWVEVQTNACTLRDTVRVNYFSPLPTQIRYNGNPVSNLTFCAGSGTQTITASDPAHPAGTAYSWQNLNTLVFLGNQPSIGIAPVGNTFPQTQRYEVQITDPTNGCLTRDTLEVIFESNPETAIQFQGQTADTLRFCNDRDIPVTLEADYANPNPQVSFLWTNLSTNATATGSTLDVLHPSEAFDYELTTTDGSLTTGCDVARDTVRVIFRALPTAEIYWQGNPTDTFRLCDTDGAQTVSASTTTHTAAFSYEWRNLSTGATISSSATATLDNFSDSVAFELLVRQDENGLLCESRDTIIAVFYPAANAQTSGLPQDVFRFCDSDGAQTLEAAAPSGTFPVSYTWTDITRAASTVVSNSRTVTVSNFSDTTVYQIDVTTNVFTSVQCENQDTATAIFYTNPTVSIAVSGTARDSVSFCDSEGAQTLTAQPAGTTAPSFQWYGYTPATGASTTLAGQTNASLSVSDFSATRYFIVEVRDETVPNRCSAYDTIAVRFLENPIFSIPEEFFICESEVVISAGITGNLSYDWTATNGFTATTESITATAAGTYYLSVTDLDNGCTHTDSSEVAIPGTLVADIRYADSLTYCAGDPITFDVRDPSHNAGLQFSWSTGESQPLITQTTAAGTNTISVTITDPLTGCSNADTLQYLVNPLPDLSLLPDSARFCAPSDTLGTGFPDGFSYQWSGGTILSDPTQKQILVGTEGVYSVSATDPQTGCQNATSVQVLFDPLPLLDLRDVSVCTNDSVLLIAQDLSHGSQIQYEWTNLTTGSSVTAAGTLGVTQSGTFSVLVTDTLTGCSVRDTASVEVLPLPDFTIIGYQNSNCAGRDTLGVSPDNSVWQVVWSGGTPLNNGRETILTTSGTYTVRVTNPNTGCSVQKSQAVQLDRAPVLAFSETTFKLCQSESLTLNAASAQHPSGTRYIWRDAATDSVLSDSSRITLNGEDYVDNFSLEIEYRSAGFCSTSQQLNIEWNPRPTVQVAASDTVLCLGESAQLSASTNAAIRWSNGETRTAFSFTPEVAGTYFFFAETQVPDGSCPAARDTLQIAVNEMPTASLPESRRLCQSDTLRLRNTPADTSLSYQWTSNGTLISDSAVLFRAYAGEEIETLQLIVENRSGCRDTAQTSVRWDAATQAQILPDQRRVQTCLGETLMLEGQGGAELRWSTGQTGATLRFEAKEVGTFPFVLTATNTGNCPSSRDTIFVTVNPLPEVRISPNEDQTLCQGDSIRLIASGATDYRWPELGTTEDTLWLRQTPVPTLRVIGTDSTTGCAAVASITINYVPTAQLPAYRQACEGDTIQLDATVPVPATYLWQGFVEEPILRVSGSGTYTVEVTSAECQYERSVQVEFLPYPEVVLPGDTLLCLDSLPKITAAVTGVTSDLSFVWINENDQVVSQQNPLNVSQSGTYTVLVRPDYPQKTCAAAASVSVGERCPDQIFIPTAFSPNGDGRNDVFSVFGRNITDVQIEVWDRWGRLVFVSPEEGSPAWDGRDRSNARARSGQYTYRVSYQTLTADGNRIVRRVLGRLVLVR